jgi:hypothetical protein
LKQKEPNANREWFQTRNERIQEQDKLRLDSYNGKKKKVPKEEREQFQKIKTVNPFLLFPPIYMSQFRLFRLMTE